MSISFARYYRDRRPIVESARTPDKTEAKKLLRQRQADIDRGLPFGPKVGRIWFEEAAEDVMTDYRVNSRRSLDELERRIRLHLQPVFGNRRMAAITMADIRSSQSAGSRLAPRMVRSIGSSPP